MQTRIMWRPLNLNIPSKAIICPLVKHEFGLTSYVIHLTDLTHLWTESLDRRQIIRRAIDLNTSIDPSEDGTQMRVFLDHIQHALEGALGTAVSLSEEDRSNRLSLNISVTLPSPLAPLEWPILLQRASQDLITSQLMLPCLGQILSLRAQTDSLLRHLRDKDGVIRKLTDKIQSDGTDLSKVFPGSALIRSGSKLNAREAVSRSVKGLASFDELEWRETFAANNDIPSSPRELMKSVFSSAHSDAQKFGQPTASQTRWARPRFDDTKPATIHDYLSHHQVKSPQPSIKREGNSSFNDFQVCNYYPFCLNKCACLLLTRLQRQSTPPSRSPREDKGGSVGNGSRRTSLRQSASDGDATTDDSERKERAHQNPGKPKKASSISPRRSRGIKSNSRSISPASDGTIQKTSTKAASASNSPHSPTDAPSIDGRETEDDLDLIPKRTGKASFNKASVPNTPKSKHKLGKIGTRKKGAVPSTDEEELSVKTSISKDAPKSEDAAVKKPRHKLGKIGGGARTTVEGSDNTKDSTTHDKPSLHNGSKGPGRDQDINITQNISQPEPNLSGAAVPSSEAKQRSPGKISNMQANENRERLKRELETKCSNINKKKRKF